jgi:hypothetical protein
VAGGQREIYRMARSKEPVVEIQREGRNVFLLIDGVKIAMRGEPGSPQARTWVSLEPGYTVLDTDDGNIEIIREGVRLH